jgi:lipoate-protein ligase A
MNYLDFTLPTPAENLACDEALLDRAESAGGPAVLRFWESPQLFVVLGYANKVAEEVNVEACCALGVPILRRCSGGGTVLQGPGCLNYSLVLRSSDTGPQQTITEANHFVMQRNRQTIEALLGRLVTVEGVTDLALDQLKFSGNAQRRKRDWFLFHGTFLLHFDLSLIEGFLRPPPRQPEYRRQRPHAEFLTQIETSSAQLKAALRGAWAADSTGAAVPDADIARLVSEKYGREDWNLKW